MIRSTTLLLVLVAALAAAAPATTARQAIQRETPIELAVVQQVNALRTARGLRPLTVSPGLRTAAIGHTQTLARLGLFQHESADGTTFHKRISKTYGHTGFGSWSVGENLVFGSAPFAAEDAIRAWLDSPPHRKNLLNPAWREIGVGAVTAQGAPGVFGGDTVVLVTADFGARSR